LAFLTVIESHTTAEPAIVLFPEGGRKFARTVAGRSTSICPKLALPG
jgi:hypothetical protein